MHEAAGHIHQHTNENRNLLVTVLLNIFISVAELAGGIFSNSLALISDAIHNFSDGLAIAITYISQRISNKQSDNTNTFGYKRIQILAALFNAVTLIAICIFLLFEAYQRFLNPEPVQSAPMFIVATIGLIANIAGVFLLKDFSASNLNIRAAYLHLIGDSLSSVAVIAGGGLMYFFDVPWIDPLITVLISLYIIRETYHVLAETYSILMQSSPKSIDINLIREQITMIPGINDIHHVHIWSLTDQMVHFEGHIEFSEDLRISESQDIYRQIKELLENHHGIHHITLQAEFNFCCEKHLVSPTHLC
ncbi:MAG: cation transporter [Bacteroidales bacterium]|nr:cation transporter [Bacteroidales bacterium]